MILHSRNSKRFSPASEDFRSGYRKGKLKQNKSYLHSNADKTISEMVEDERQSKREGKVSMDEIAARNIARLGSHYKGSRKKGPGLSSGVDEEDYGGDGGVDMKIFTESSDQLSGVAKYAREKSRLIAKADKELAITNRCWWWIESASFRKHMLLSLGDHVRLIPSTHYFIFNVMSSVLPNFILITLMVIGIFSFITKSPFSCELSVYLGSC